MAEMTTPVGIVILDVNNRYNAAYYGWARTLRNVLSDLFRHVDAGDFVTHFTNGSTSVSAIVHLFSRRELEDLTERAGLRPIALEFVDYDTGARSGSQWRGQMWAISEPA